MILSDGSPEKSFASVTGGGAIVFSCRPVAADGAVLTKDGGPRHPSTAAATERCRQRVVARHRHFRIRCNEMHPDTGGFPRVIKRKENKTEVIAKKKRFCCKGKRDFLEEAERKLFGLGFKCFCRKKQKF